MWSPKHPKKNGPLFVRQNNESWQSFVSYHLCGLCGSGRLGESVLLQALKFGGMRWRRYWGKAGEDTARGHEPRCPRGIKGLAGRTASVFPDSFVAKVTLPRRTYTWPPNTSVSFFHLQNSAKLVQSGQCAFKAFCEFWLEIFPAHHQS